MATTDSASLLKKPFNPKLSLTTTGEGGKSTAANDPLPIDIICLYTQTLKIEINETSITMTIDFSTVHSCFRCLLAFVITFHPHCIINKICFFSTLLFVGDCHFVKWFVCLFVFYKMHMDCSFELLCLHLRQKEK